MPIHHFRNKNNSSFDDWNLADKIAEVVMTCPSPFFRSQHELQSWLSTLATILNVSALVLISIEGIPPRIARLTFAMARHAVVDLGHTLGRPLQESKIDRLSSDDFVRLCELLQMHNVYLANGIVAETKLRKLRNLYEPYLNSLSEAFSMPIADRLPQSNEKDNWLRTAES